MRAIALILFALLTSCGDKRVVVPEVFKVKFETSQGDVVVEAHRAWSPRGADRFHELVRMRYFDEGRFFRVVPGFIAQFGVHKDYDIHGRWRRYFILDDPLEGKDMQKNLRGTLAFAKSGPNTRATEMFINLNDNPALDADGFLPFARVIYGMESVDRFYAGYGEMRPEGKFIDPGRVEEGANAYLVSRFPKMDFIRRARFDPK